jgi:ketosteroid isomerase-like protein
MSLPDLSPDKIREVAKKLDDALERKDIEFVVSCFSENCEIEVLGVHLRGKEGVRKWLTWLYKDVPTLEFEPVTIMVDKNVFFEEFIVHGTLQGGKAVQSKQAEVLLYDDDYKVKGLRLYFDRLDFADAVTRDFISKGIVRQIINLSLKGLK